MDSGFWEFLQIQEVGYFPTWFIFSLRHSNGRGSYGRPRKLVPNFGIKGYGLHDQFHTVTDCGS